MTPAQAIAMLDEQLAENGQTVVLRREGSPVLTASVRAFVRKADPDPLTDAASQDKRVIVLSPTDLPAWSPSLQKGDLLRILDGAFVSILELERVVMNDQIVRLNLRATG